MKHGHSLRGRALDEAIDALLAEMISSGFERAPISRSEIQRRLGLTSRATLVGERGTRIDSARDAQLRESGQDPDSHRRRRTLEERITSLQKENAALASQRDQLYEALTVIAHNCLMNGLNVEEVLAPLRKRINR